MRASVRRWTRIVGIGEMSGDAALMETRERAPAVIHLVDERQLSKKVTSGSENRQRTKAVRVRLHPADAERLRIEAANAGMSVAGYLATGRLSTEASTRPRMQRRRVQVDVAALNQGLVEFSRAGSLLNQLTRAGNVIAQSIGGEGDEQILEKLSELVDEIAGLRALFAVPVAQIQAALGDDREG